MPVVLWLLAEPLSLEGDANGAEMQLPVWRIIRIASASVLFFVMIIRRGKQTKTAEVRF